MRNFIFLVPMAPLILYAQPVDMAFVKIRPGEFLMGCSPQDMAYMPDGTYSPCPDNAQPRHAVRITRAFEIGADEVTQAQWKAVMDNNPSYFKGPDRPVEQVGWDDAQEFLNRLNARGDGYRYRLPTEAEWEYAARAGSTDLFVDSRLSGVAWYGAGGANLLQSKGETHDVGRKQPNAWGLYDVHGNVNEWVQDWFSADYYRNSPRDDPAGPATGRTRVTRGGSWYSNASYLRLSNRYEMFAGLSRRDVGFRCVREAIR